MLIHALSEDLSCNKIHFREFQGHLHLKYTVFKHTFLECSCPSCSRTILSLVVCFASVQTLSVVVNTDGQLDRVWIHLEYKLLGVSVRDSPH